MNKYQVLYVMKSILLFAGIGLLLSLVLLFLAGFLQTSLPVGITIAAITGYSALFPGFYGGLLSLMRKDR